MGSKRMLSIGPSPSIGSPSRLTARPRHLFADRDADRAARVLDVHAARQAARGGHGDAAHHVVAQVFLHFEHDVERRARRPRMRSALCSAGRSRRRTRHPPPARPHERLFRAMPSPYTLPCPTPPADQLEHLGRDALLAQPAVARRQIARAISPAFSVARLMAACRAAFSDAEAVQEGVVEHDWSHEFREAAVPGSPPAAGSKAAAPARRRTPGSSRQRARQQPLDHRLLAQAGHEPRVQHVDLAQLAAEEAVDDERGDPSIACAPWCAPVPRLRGIARRCRGRARETHPPRASVDDFAHRDEPELLGSAARCREVARVPRSAPC